MYKGLEIESDVVKENLGRCYSCRLASHYSRSSRQHGTTVEHAYHSTVHVPTGYTPHRLLFGWCPRDLRAPVVAEHDGIHVDVQLWT